MDATARTIGKGTVPFVWFSTIAHEKTPPPLPDPQKHNEQIGQYSKAIESIAEARNARFIPLLTLLDQKSAPAYTPPLTDDGIHLTAYGYRRTAEMIDRSLNWQPNACRHGMLRNGTFSRGANGVQEHEYATSDDS